MCVYIDLDINKTLRSAFPSNLQNASSLMLLLLESPSSVKEQRGPLTEEETEKHAVWTWGLENRSHLGHRQCEGHSHLQGPDILLQEARFLAWGKLFSLVTELSASLPRNGLVY